MIIIIYKTNVKYLKRYLIEQIKFYLCLRNKNF